MEASNVQNQTENIETLSSKSFMNGLKAKGFLFKKVSAAIALVIVLSVAVLFVLISYFVDKQSSMPLLKPIVFKGEMGDVPTVVNPLTGQIYGESAVLAWKDMRPLAVMINNHVDARPQAGLVNADVVYEMVAEGGITRFLAFFLSDVPEKIGPIRSAREYYLVLVKELGDAMLMHIGWSPQALEAIETWPIKSLGRGGATFWRENPKDVAVEHTAYSNGKDLLQRGLELGWDGKAEFDSWRYKDDMIGSEAAKPATSLAIDFWYKGDYSAIWEYDQLNNVYARFMGYDDQSRPVAHVDDMTKEQIRAKNVIVQFVEESNVIGDDKGRLDYKLVGAGNALIFLDGKVIDAVWDKDERDERTVFYDISGKEILFNRGKTWVAVVPDRNADQIVYK
ncbi:DUF3048 domain-containing protein [candidate division WWE3 bacterium]|nr:DUF3048 domain-containing protein [candidate division WWE3 bacterium]